MLPRVIEPQLVAAPSGETDVVENVSYGLNQLLVAAGFTSYLSSNPYPNTRWYQSRGEDGDHNICFGLCPIVTANSLRILPFVAADLNTFGATVGVSSLTTVAGFVNDDNTSVVNVSGASAGPRFAHPQPGGTAFNSGITPRNALSDIEFWASANKDRLNVFQKYVSNATNAQTILSMGMAETILANELHRTARARLYSVTLVAGTTYDVVLDRNINNALNDIFGGDPDPYATRLLFQAVATNAGEIAANTGFAQTERVGIVPGSLTTDGSGRTKFQVNTASCNASGGASAKLWATGNRYARATPLGTILSPSNGLGDIVSLTSDPNYCIGAGRNDGAAYTNASNTLAVAAWRNNGAQRAFTPNATPGSNAASFTPLQLNVTNYQFSGYNPASVYSTSNDPNPLINRAPSYAIYLSYLAGTSTVLPEVDGDVREPTYCLPDIMFAPKVTGVPDRAVARRNARATERYRTMEFIASQGMRTLTDRLGFDGSVYYTFGIRGNWV